MTQNCTDRADNAPLAKRTGKKRFGILLGSLFLIALCATIRYYWGADAANADPTGRDTSRTTANAVPSSPQEGQPARSGAATAPSARSSSAQKTAAAADTASEPEVPAVVATVNTQKISREDLYRECLRHYGKELLESMVNKRLIMQECKRQGITITRAEVAAEIERRAKQLHVPVDQLLKTLKQEHKVTPEQYADDRVWPTLALRKLAGGRLSVSKEDLEKEFETEYGAMVQARLMAFNELEKAEKIRAQAAAKPDDFGNLAKEFSEDAPSASVKGVIQPIRKHGSYKEIEDAVFNMADGEVSPVIHAGGQYLILKREGLLPAKRVSFEEAVPQLEQTLRDSKLHAVARDIFQQLQKGAKIENVWNDPAKRAKLPAVAALVNGESITLQELAEQCAVWHGQEVLERIINRKLIELTCQRQSIAVTDQDIDQEIAQAAAAHGKLKPDGSPDVAAWLESETKKQGVSLDVYRNGTWPLVALKKLVGKNVKVTDEDLHKGYEANYGARVRCLAIVLDNQRRAEKVFDLARRDNTAENFGDLATQYSIEPGSQSLRGEVPPIKKNGGQPILEEEAYKLKPGELSGVIQVGDKFIILRCEDYTKALDVDFAAVRDDIYQDLLEKKTELAMVEYFENLKDSATIDNYLAGTSHSPKKADAASQGPKVPTLRQLPGG